MLRSLIVLKALTFEPTGGIVAAPTTSLPEQIGGVRNWDYRFCWLRDATFTLYSLLSLRLHRRGGGVARVAAARRRRRPGGSADHVRPARRAAAHRAGAAPGCPGYESSRPVRIGNAAVDQLQLDVYGEVMDALYVALARRRRAGSPRPGRCSAAGRVPRTRWREPDEGIWEVRGPRRHFTHSKVMAWVAVDRAIKIVEELRVRGPARRWISACATRSTRDVCTHGFNAARNAFTQYYGSNELDASLLMIPLVGFLPAEDPRVAGTTAAIERELMEDGFVHRYRIDALPRSTASRPAKASSCRARSGCATTTRLPDGTTKPGSCSSGSCRSATISACCRKNTIRADERLLGNFPQAFSHVSLSTPR